MIHCTCQRIMGLYFTDAADVCLCHTLLGAGIYTRHKCKHHFQVRSNMSGWQTNGADGAVEKLTLCRPGWGGAPQRLLCLAWCHVLLLP